jgi:hypothetical protein
VAIDEPNVIDVTGIDHVNGETVLVICDHLPWNVEDPDPLYTEGDHLYMLQGKVYRYLDFIESGEVFEKIERAKGTTPVILIKFLYPLSRNATNLVNNLKQYLGSMDVEVRWEVNDPQTSDAPSRSVN